MKNYTKNPYAERIKEYGCTIRVTHGSGVNKKIINERVVTPKEIEVSNERREMNLQRN
jgi:hypothetical protein